MTSVDPAGRYDPSGGRLAKYWWDLRTFPSDAASAWRMDGASGLWEEFANRSFYRLARWDRLLVVEQDLQAVREAPPPSGVSIERFAGPDWDWLAPVATLRVRKSFPTWAAGGRVCIVAARDGFPVGYGWYSQEMDADLGVYRLQLPSGAVFTFRLHVSRQERNHGVGSALVRARLADARERGFRVAWRLIAPENAPTLRTAAKTTGTGTRIVGELHFLKLLSRISVRLEPWRGSDELLRSSP